jgi:hypothetical protein
MFFSAKREFNALEGQLFTTPERVLKAAIRQEAKESTRFRTSAK